VKPVKDEPKIIVELRPDQLASLIDALGLASECEQEDAGCCTWTLYESIRNYIYDVNHCDRDSLQPDLAAGKQMVHADNQIRRRKHIAK
jgi:hypothetical protein